MTQFELALFGACISRKTTSMQEKGVVFDVVSAATWILKGVRRKLLLLGNYFFFQLKLFIE